ncbi:MAG: hypothetical protein U0V70_16360 [Terriglobia bacterium]
MPYPTLMYLHYVMEAQDYFREAQQEGTAAAKLDKLAAAFDALKQASEHGAPNETVRELRLRYYEEFLTITKEEPPPIS